MNLDLAQVFARVDERPTAATYLQAARQTAECKGQLSPVRIAFLSSFTLDSLLPFLTVEAARFGFTIEAYVAPFNSVKPELLGADSGCIHHRPDVVFVANLLGDVRPDLAHDTLSGNAESLQQVVNEFAADLTAPIRHFRSRSKAAVVFHTLPRPYPAPLGVYEAIAIGSQSNLVNRLNARLATVMNELPGGYLLDLDHICATVGYENCYDPRMWYLARAPFSAALWLAWAREQAAFLLALLAPPRKCLVLDLDNVLWGGIIGENGLANIQLGQTYPGSVYRDFQRTLLELHDRGVLLAINSKNNLDDVEEAFHSHPDMILKWEHFACRRINWKSKTENMQEIAHELNIGLDSLVFFDDDPVEQARMRQSLPSVLTLPVPREPIQYVKVLRHSRAFDRLTATEEDRRRGAMYQEQAARHQLRDSAASVEDFLTSLQMTAHIEPVGDFAFPRAVDLLQKTNQFNLTTRRHAPAHLKTLLADPQYGVFTLRVTDRFGDNGVVGLAIIQKRGDTAHIESFLLSCRVIGRTVETALLSFLAGWARASGASALEGEYLPTPKNGPAADFYSRHGFTPIEQGPHGSRWRMDLAQASIQWPPYIGGNSHPVKSTAPL
jgi:FkbH-like protein